MSIEERNGLDHADDCRTRAGLLTCDCDGPRQTPAAPNPRPVIEALKALMLVEDVQGMNRYQFVGAMLERIPGVQLDHEDALAARLSALWDVLILDPSKVPSQYEPPSSVRAWNGRGQWGNDVGAG